MVQLNIVPDNMALVENLPPIKRKKKVCRSKSFRRCRAIDHNSSRDSQYDEGQLQAKRLLSTIGDWSFNMFSLNKLTNGRALFHTSLHLFQEHNLIEIFRLDIIKLMRFISLVEEGYHSSNPYHNAVHAADVTQAMHCYLKETKLDQCLSPLEKLSALVSALTHDLDHPGVNQAFLIATSNHLAALYNNCSVLENHHWRSAIGLLHESGVFEHFDQSLWKTVEWQIKSLILATDITRQQEFLLRLRTSLDQKNLNLDDIEHKNFVLQIALKCADISNPGRPWELSKRWSELVCDEFFKQGDCERQFNLPVTPFCDRLSTTVPKIQTGFMNYVVLPLFREWYRFNPTALSEQMLSHIQTNADNWDRIALEAASQKVKPEETLAEEEEEDEEEEEEEEEEESRDTVPTTSHTFHTVVVIEKSAVVDDEEKENTELTTTLPGDLPDNLPELAKINADIIPLCLYRRHSLPPPQITGADCLLSSRRESLPRYLSRRYSLPVGDLPNSNSFDRLVEKLSSLVECSPTNGTHFDYDQRPRIVSISQSLDAKTLSSAALEASKLTSAHGLDPALFAHRPYTSEPHIAMLAHQFKLNNRLGNLAYLAKNLSVAGIVPRLHANIESRGDKYRRSLPSLSTGPSGGLKLTLPGKSGSRDLGPSMERELRGMRDDERRSSQEETLKTRDDNTDKLLMTAIHCGDAVDATSLSGAEKIDRSDTSRTSHLSSNHISSSVESPNNPVTMTTSTQAGDIEEKTPLLMVHPSPGTKHSDTKHSHSNESYRH